MLGGVIPSNYMFGIFALVAYMSNKRRKQRAEAVLKSEDVNGFLEEFQNESDRATAVLGAAFLDEQLYQLLLAFFVDDLQEADELLAVEKPLGSLGARIRLAYCVGLLSKEDFDDLKTIKNIRNAFAHQLHGLVFDNAEIVKECEKLKIAERIMQSVKSSARNRFTEAVTLLWMQLAMKRLDLNRCTSPSALTVSQHIYV